jgi:hypothetical protein
MPSVSQESGGINGLVTPVQIAPLFSQSSLQLGEVSAPTEGGGVRVKQVSRPENRVSEF